MTTQQNVIRIVSITITMEVLRAVMISFSVVRFIVVLSKNFVSLRVKGGYKSIADHRHQVMADF